MMKEGEASVIQSLRTFSFRHSLFDIRCSLNGLHGQLACIVTFVRGSGSHQPPRDL